MPAKLHMTSSWKLVVQLVYFHLLSLGALGPN
jgi:hypothetical protein